MKLILLMYLEGDEAAVLEMLRRQGVTTWSHVTLEGHASGQTGWYGEVAPYRSRMVFSVVPSAQAEQLLEAVATCSGCEDPSHPVRAMQLDVERSVSAGSLPSNSA